MVTTFKKSGFSAIIIVLCGLAIFVSIVAVVYSKKATIQPPSQPIPTVASLIHTIEDIIAQPKTFDGKTVTISGKLVPNARRMIKILCIQSSPNPTPVMKQNYHFYDPAAYELTDGATSIGIVGLESWSDFGSVQYPKLSAQDRVSFTGTIRTATVPDRCDQTTIYQSVYLDVIIPR